jgi:hypothetical protein
MAGVAQLWFTERELEFLSKVLAHSFTEPDYATAVGIRRKVVGALDPISCHAEVGSECDQATGSTIPTPRDPGDKTDA